MSLLNTENFGCWAHKCSGVWLSQWLKIFQSSFEIWVKLDYFAIKFYSLGCTGVAWENFLFGEFSLFFVEQLKKAE